MNKISILVAAGLVTFSVSDPAQAACNEAHGNNGLDALATAQTKTQENAPITVFQSLILSNRELDAGEGNGGELQFEGCADIASETAEFEGDPTKPTQ